jgi:hypothetical protein
MSLRALLTPILDDDHVTRGLDDAEARMLIEWLAERAEGCLVHLPTQKRRRAEVERLCRRGRLIARFVSLWCYEGSPAAALQLAATERFAWPLPTADMDPCDLLGDILAWEDTPENERESTDE